MRLLIDKYKPKSLNEINGLDKEIKILKNFIINFKKGKALLIFGPSGSGKTSSVYALAKDLNYELFELNASNLRDRESIEKILDSVVKQKSLFLKRKIILVDEIDGMSSEDKGGLQALVRIIGESNIPIIITCNDIDLEKLEILIKNSILSEYNKLDNTLIFSKLKEICDNEKIEYKVESLKKLAEISKGDLRAAIMDLQTLSLNKILDTNNLEDLDRLQFENIKNVLNIIFKENNLNKSLKNINLLNIDLIDVSKKIIYPVIFSNDNVLYYWLEENIPLQYDSNSITNSFEMLSKIDLFRGRIMKRQYWRYLAYIVDLFSAISLNKSSNILTSYKRTKRSPKNNKKLWFLVSRKKKDIAEKISTKSHESIRNIINNFFYYKLILRNKNLQNFFGLDKEEILWLEK